jgi:membrane associated rhomboid family serine protease
MSELKFYSSIISSIYCGFASGAYLFLLLPLMTILINTLTPSKVDIMSVFIYSARSISCFILIYSLVAIYLYPITIKAQGIRGYNFWGVYSFVAWEEIDRIEPYKSFGLWYLRLFFHNSYAPIWLPLFLQQQEKFNQTIIKFTAPDNPLHQALLNQKKLFERVSFHGKPKNTTKFKAQDKQHNPTPFLKIDNQFQQRNNNLAPWSMSESFALPPEVDEYGYCVGKKLSSCTRPSLIENLKTDANKRINLVWTPEKPYLISPEEVNFLLDAVNLRDKIHAKKKLNGSLLNLLIWGGIFWQNLDNHPAIKQIMLFNWVAIAVIPTLENGWELYQSQQTKTTQEIANRIQQSRYLAWLQNSQSFWTIGLASCISLVAVAQLIIFFIPELISSIESAGIIKSAVRQGEIWRLLTGTLLHGNILHFVFNIYALFALSKLIEVTMNKYYIPLVFVITALSGSLFSLIFIPDTPSVGASGGIMGLLGFLMVFSLKAPKILPSTNKIMLFKAAIYTFLAGLLAKDVIDNPAHFGGFLAGVLLGLILLPNKQLTIPLEISPIQEKIGLAFAVFTIVITVFTVLKLLMLI